jgi:hypothetical protein
MQTRQALLLSASVSNLYRWRHRCLFLRMSTKPHLLRMAILGETDLE